MRRSTYFCVVALTGLLAGCASSSLERNALPQPLVGQAEVPGFEDIRHWANESRPVRVAELQGLSVEEVRALYPGIYGVGHTYLAISGGGAKGAYTAGLLNGWTAAGNRPQFTMVTGVSTGAIIAPFAFLGSKYDHVIKLIYTEFSTKDVAEERGFLKTLLSDAGADTAPLASRIEQFITPEVMAEIAKETGKGRYLSVVTTNLDVGRAVGWDIGAIARSGHPQALQLIHRVILASASIPGAFPPVMFEVQADGQSYDEMHVDGGAASVVHLYPMNLDMREVTERLAVPSSPDVYVIRNGQLNKRYKAVSRSTLPVLTQTLGSLMDNIVYGDLYRIYLASKRDGLDFHMTSIPPEFQHESDEPFDPEYMSALYKLGYERAAAGYEWESYPPGFEAGL